MVPEQGIIETKVFVTVPDEMLLTDQDSEFVRDVAPHETANEAPCTR